MGVSGMDAPRTGSWAESEQQRDRGLREVRERLKSKARRIAAGLDRVTGDLCGVFWRPFLEVRWERFRRPS